MERKGIKIWVLSTLTFFALIHTIDASTAFLLNGQVQLTKMYPLVAEYLTQLPADLYFYISAAITVALWGLTCIVAFNNPFRDFPKRSNGGRSSVGAYKRAGNRRTQRHLSDLMYQTVEENKREMEQTNNLVSNLRAEIKDTRERESETFEGISAALAGLKKQVDVLEEKMIFPLLCKSCGKPLRADFSICPYCGLKIDTRQAAVVREPSFSHKQRVNKKAKGKQAKGCQYWFGYLSQKEKDKPIPEKCEECNRAVECMLNQICSSAAVTEIKKYY